MRVKVEFVFDKTKDLDNIWRTVNKEVRFMDFSGKIPQKVVEIAKGKEFAECEKELRRYYSKAHDSKILKIFVRAINDSWQHIEKEYFKRLTKLTGKSLDEPEIRGWVTFSPKCPYNPKNYSFFVSFYSSLPQVMVTAGHEIMHLHFHKYYWDKIEKELGHDKTADLKEALTVLLNKEFYDLWQVSDVGYEMHKELRKFIFKKWYETKDFDVLLNKCVRYLKKNE